MGAFLPDAPIGKENDAVTEPGGGQAVGDEHRGFPGGHGTVFLIYVIFRQRVQGGCGFVQQQDGAVLVQGSGQHQQLGLAAGEQNSI